jgi:hypothetical protein
MNCGISLALFNNILLRNIQNHANIYKECLTLDKEILINASVYCSSVVLVGFILLTTTIARLFLRSSN